MQRSKKGSARLITLQSGRGSQKGEGKEEKPRLRGRRGTHIRSAAILLFLRYMKRGVGGGKGEDGEEGGDKVFLRGNRRRCRLRGRRGLR